VKQLNPDIFVAFSYPPDTMAITEQARALNFNPKVFYTAVGTAFPMYKQRFGTDAEGVMGIGGWNPDAPESKAYFKRHVAVTGQEPDRWASPITYASLQMLQQAIERVGKIDRAAVDQGTADGDVPDHRWADQAEGQPVHGNMVPRAVAERGVLRDRAGDAARRAPDHVPQADVAC